MRHNRIIKICSVALFIATMLTGYRGWSQTSINNMINGDSILLDACTLDDGIIYDDGGVSGNYSNNFNGLVTILAGPGSTISLKISYSTEAECDHITIEDGFSTFLAKLSGYGDSTITSSTGSVVIRFTSDGSVTNSGFKIEWSVEDATNVCTNVVSALDTTAVTSNSIALTWTSSNASGPFTIVCNGTTYSGITSTSYTLTGLNASTLYTIEVVNTADGDNRCCADRINVRTLCGNTTLPFSEGFEGLADGSLPPCWILSRNFDEEESQPQVVATQHASGVRSLMLSCGNTESSGHFGVVGSPILHSTGDHKIRLRLRTSHSGTALEIGTCDSTGNDYNQYNFSPIQTIYLYNTGEWMEYTVDWNSTDNSKRLAMRMQQSMQNGIGRRVYIDDFNVEDCGVDSVQAIHIEHDKLQLTWSIFGSPVCNVSVRREGTLVDTLNFSSVTSPLDITGLQSETRYILTVHPICSSIPGLSRSTAVKTKSTPTAAEGYCSNFSLSTQLPTEWTFNVIQGYCGASFDLSNRSVNFRDGCSGAKALMVSEQLLGLPGKEIAVTYSGYNNNARLIIGTMVYADDLSTFVPLDTAYSDGGRHTPVVKVPSSSTGRHIAIMFENPSWFIECSIHSVSCGSHMLEEGRVLHRRGTNMVLSWAKAYDTVLVQYGPHDFALGSGTTDTFYNVHHATVEGLTPSTEYDVFAYLASQVPCEDMRYTRRTATTDYPIPYCENFDNVDEYNSWNYNYGDWKKINELNGTPSFSDQYYNYTGKALELLSWGFNDSYYSTALLPDMVLDSNTVLSFYAFDRAPNSMLMIGVVDDDYERTANLRILDTIHISAQYKRVHYRYTFRPSDTLFDGRVAICYKHNYAYSNYGIFIDELHFNHQAYDTMTLIHVGQDTATLSLNGLYRADSIEVCLYGSDTLCQVVPKADIASIGFGGLDSGGFYHVYARPLNEGCLSYVTSFSLVGGAGYANCFKFDDLLSDELPREWAATDGVSISNDDALQLVADAAVAMHRMSYIDSNTFSFYARSHTSGDTLLLGRIDGSSIPANVSTITTLPSSWSAIDTFVLDTAWQFFIFPLPSFGSDSIRLTFVGGSDTVWIDEVGIIDCPIVHFKVDGNRLICTQDRQFSYYLTINDSAGNDHRELLITENPYMVEGLHMDTRYDLSWECLYRGTSCQPNVSVYTGSIIPLPYCEDFDKGLGTINIPPTWTYISGGTYDQLRLDTWGPSLYVSSSSYNKWNYAILPKVASDSVLTLRAHINSSSNGSTQIGVLDDESDTSTFIPLWSSGYSNDEHIMLDLSEYAHKRIAIRTSGWYYLFRIHLYNIPLANVALLGADSIAVTTTHIAPYWLRNHRPKWNDQYDLDTLLFINDSIHLITNSHRNGLYLSQVCDSTGYTCDNEDYYQLGESTTLPFCFDPDITTWPWDRFIYSSKYNYGYPSWTRPDYSDKRVMRLNGKSSIWSVGPDFTSLDSIRHAGMRIHYVAASEHDSLEVGVMVNAYDTLSFTPLDTLVYNPAGEKEQSAYIDLSKYTGGGRWLAVHAMPGPKADWVDITRLYVDACPASLGATASLSRWNRIKIDGPHTPFYVEYFPTGTSTQGSTENTIIRIDSVPQILILEPETRYDFYFRCDSAGYTCTDPQQVTTLAAPLQMPTCVDFDTVDNGQIPRNWTSRHIDIGVTDAESHSTPNSLSIPIGSNSYIITPDIDIDSISKVAVSIWFRVEDLSDRLVVGVMSNPSDLSTFYPVSTLTPAETNVWQRGLVEFRNAPQESHFIALRARSNRQAGGRAILVDDIFVTDCAAFNLTVDKLTNSAIDLSWNQVGNPDISITVLDDSTVVQSFDNPTSPLHIEPLETLHYYTFRMESTCSGSTGYCTSDYQDSLSVVTPAPGVGCVNPTDLASPQAVFFSGSYSNPYSHAGAINYGSLHPDSRHTVCYDTAQRDPRTGNLLHTIPPGYTSSVRLGNWSTNYYSPEAEGVIYSLFVDTNSFELLLLRYAAVLQDPAHDPSDQPRFRMELLDTNYNIIDSACTSADFIADLSLGWNTADDGVLWKDWTAVGIDLSAHANEQVYLRLTTYDCNEGSHYGYAYFTLECMRKNMNTVACGDVDSNTLSAPEGFHYRWYTSSSTATYSTAQTITVPSEDITYYCEVSKLDNPNCKFLINTYGGTRYPISNFTTSMTIDSCRFHVNFENLSGVSKDGVNLIPGEQCEAFWWDLGNGATATTFNAQTTYNKPGTYTVRLVSGISLNACTDTLVMEINLELPEGMAPSDTVQASICDNQEYTFFNTTYTEAGTHIHNQPIPGAYCDSLHYLILDVRPTSVDDTVAIVCDSIHWMGSTYDTTGMYYTGVVGPNIVGCDSSRTLHLTVYSSYDTVDTIRFCPDQIYEYRDVQFDSPRVFDTILTTIDGCDSLIHVALLPRTDYHLNVIYTTTDSTDSVVWTPTDSILLGCNPAHLVVSDTTHNSASWQWRLYTPDSLILSDQSSISYSFPKGSPYLSAYLHLIAKSDYGCSDTMSWPLYVFQSPLPDFKWEPDIPAIHQPEVQFHNTSSPFDSLYFLWSITSQAGAFDTTSEPNPHYQWGDPGADLAGEYPVELAASWDHQLDTFRLDTIGWLIRQVDFALPVTLYEVDLLHTCTQTAYDTVIISNDYLQFPNLVTPNDDGVNDQWKIVGLLENGDYSMNELWIYDRTGALVFHRRNIRSEDQFWNPNDTRSPDGTYYYRFSGKGQYGLCRRNGVIEVMRKAPTDEQ